MRILIVDDNYTNRVQIKSLLSKYGDVDAVPNGDIAFDIFVAAHNDGVPYSLITMDIDLGGTDGREIVAKIREWEEKMEIFKNDLEAKILMVTVKDSSNDVFSSFSKGCEGYLIKPVTPESLQNELEKIGLIG